MYVVTFHHRYYTLDDDDNDDNLFYFIEPCASYQVSLYKMILSFFILSQLRLLKTNHQPTTTAKTQKHAYRFLTVYILFIYRYCNSPSNSVQLSGTI